MSYQTNTPVSEGLLHVHMFLAGCLLSWYLIGVDPMARRPDIRTALISCSSPPPGTTSSRNSCTPTYFP